MKNSIAVLIPTKNRRELLEKALESVFKQSVCPDEIVVVNDGSTDDTNDFLIKIASAHNTIHVITREKSGGVNVARNQGITYITSDWIVFLDDDDELTEDALVYVKEKINSIEEDYHLICFNTLIKNDAEDFMGGFQFKDDRDFFDPTYEEFMVKYGLRGDCKPVFRREVFMSGKYWFEESVNGFESITIRNMIKDGKKVRYYRQISTLINQKSNIDHISMSAPLKDPKKYLEIHQKDLTQHSAFYTNHQMHLIRKYLHMSRIAQRAGLYSDCVRYVYSAMRTMMAIFPYYAARILGHIRILRLGIRYRIILPMKYIGYDFLVPFFGYVYKGNLNDHIDRQVFYFGAYEFEELSLCKKYLHKDSVVLDIGANTGHHSLFFSQYAQQVYSFEPYEKMFHVLEGRVADNNIKNIKSFNFGLGDTNQFLDFFAPEGRNNGIGSFIRSEVGRNIGKLEIKKGDDVISGLGINRIDFIKIDVEGMEVSVLKGLIETIRTHKPVMFIEMSPESQKILEDQLKHVLGEYTFYGVKANNPYLFIFNKPGCVVETFVPANKTQNILCVPRSV